MNKVFLAMGIIGLTQFGLAYQGWCQEPDGSGETAARKVSDTPEGCRIESLSIPSQAMGRDIQVTVVLPPDYAKNPAAKYPVLIALHGRGAPHDTFAQMSHLRAALKEMPMIVASFDGDRAGWYIDSPRQPQSQFKTFFFQEFLPWIDQTYRTSGQRALTGFSMGGYGALYYTCCEPGMFASTSSLSGALGHFADWAKGGLSSDFNTLLGPVEENRNAYEACDVYPLLENLVMAGQKVPPLMLRCGIEDQLHSVNRDFVDFIGGLNDRIRSRFQAEHPEITDPRALGKQVASQLIDFTYVETEGAHDWPYWLSQSAAIIAFHWKHFQSADQP